MAKTTLQNRVVRKSIARSRQDIQSWTRAKRYAQQANDPKQYLLQDIYTDISNDALLTSQINNRHEPTIAADFVLQNEKGDVDEAATSALRSIPIVQDVIKAILDSELYGYSLVELSYDGAPRMTVLPRRNVDPVFGRFYFDETGGEHIRYREAKEYGKFILEFNSDHLGLLNKCVPHILFKKFAQSCWSELCEIYGIPPRYIKTNTQDEQMLGLAESMLRDMVAAAAVVIDSTEDFQFAQGVSTNGDVYNNLIRLCNNETSLAIVGAIIGQDTENGNYSKEQASIGLLGRLIQSDQRMVEMYMNTVVLPAFMRIGWLPQRSVKFAFSAIEDSADLWSKLTAILPYKDVDNDWIMEHFGIPVADKNFSLSTKPGTKLEFFA